MSTRVNATLELRARPPFSLVRTLHKKTLYGSDFYLGSPAEARTADGLHTAMRLPSGSVVGFSLEQRKTTILVRPGRRLTARQRAELRLLLRWCLDLDRDLRPFYRLAKQRRVLDEATRALRGMRVTRFPSVFEAALFAIALQQTTGGRTHKMLVALAEKYGDAATVEGRPIHVLPDAKTLAGVPESELRRRTGLGFRAPYVKRLAETAASGELPSYEQLEDEEPDAAEAALRSLPGVGSHSVEVIGPQPAFPADSWSAPILRRLLRLRPKDGDIVAAVKGFGARTFTDWQRYSFDYLLNWSLNRAGG
jgi:3-methyladenine DNA glycosylase/8-oxoguanine DNA glycosylase